METSVVTTQWLQFALTLFCLFVAQIVALYIWYQRQKTDRNAEQVRLEERHEDLRKQQLEELHAIVERDIGVVKVEVDQVKKRLCSDQTLQRERNEQLHGHLRRIETTRPTREEMDKNVNQLKELMLTTKGDLAQAMTVGFNNLDRRFDEFREYTRDMIHERQSPPKE